jgi:parvulin-like peptidyl-prolyl isomerase
LAQLSQQLQFSTGDTASIQAQVDQLREELGDIKGAPVSQETLSSMVDDLVVLQNMDDLGITVTDEEVDAFIEEQFAPAPLSSPTATPTVEPTAAAWATATTEQQSAEATQSAVASATAAAETATALATTAAQTATADAATATTAAATATAQGTEVPTPMPTPTPSETPTESASPPAEGTVTAAAGSPTAGGSPTVEGSPAASPEGSPAVGTPTDTGTPTVTTEDAIATSEALFELYQKNILSPSDVSRGEYERLIARPAIARQKVAEVLINQLPARAEQVHAQHILVQTREAADAVIQRLNNGEDFATVAREVSTDTTTAPTGGDLGWFPRGVMVDPFEQAAFSLAPGTISEPIQSTFGWHVIKVLEKDPDRPVTLSTLATLRGRAFEKWLTNERNHADISAKIALQTLQSPTEQAPTDTFQAPPDAPPTPSPTPFPTPTPLGSPDVTGSPEAPVDASPTP